MRVTVRLLLLFLFLGWLPFSILVCAQYSRVQRQGSDAQAQIQKLKRQLNEEKVARQNWQKLFRTINSNSSWDAINLSVGKEVMFDAVWHKLLDNLLECRQGALHIKVKSVDRIEQFKGDSANVRVIGVVESVNLKNLEIVVYAKRIEITDVE